MSDVNTASVTVIVGSPRATDITSFSPNVASGSVTIDMTTGTGNTTVTMPSAIAVGTGNGAKTYIVVTERTATAPTIITSVAVASNASTFTIYAKDVVGTTSADKYFSYFIYQSL